MYVNKRRYCVEMTKFFLLVDEILAVYKRVKRAITHLKRDRK